MEFGHAGTYGHHNQRAIFIWILSILTWKIEDTSASCIRRGESVVFLVAFLFSFRFCKHFSDFSAIIACLDRIAQIWTRGVNLIPNFGRLDLNFFRWWAHHEYRRFYGAWIFFVFYLRLRYGLINLRPENQEHVCKVRTTKNVHARCT